MKKRIFADGVEAISFSEGMVRMDLFNIIPSKSNNPGKPPEREITDELIIPPRGFLQAFSAMEKLVKQLMEAGVVQRNDAAEAKDAQASMPDSASPNFK
ncbi:MAG: hypothetical protein ACYC4Q_02015 [Victivallaceae bacterium]